MIPTCSKPIHHLGRLMDTRMPELSRRCVCVGGALTVREPKHQAPVRLAHSHPDCLASGQITGGECVLQSRTLCVMCQRALVCPARCQLVTSIMVMSAGIVTVTGLSQWADSRTSCVSVLPEAVGSARLPRFPLNWAIVPPWQLKTGAASYVSRAQFSSSVREMCVCAHELKN